MAANPMGRSMLGQGFGTFDPGSRGFNETGGLGNPNFQSRRPARTGEDELSQMVGALGSGIAALGAWGSTAASAVGSFAGATVEKAQSGEILGQARAGMQTARASMAPVASSLVQGAASFWQATASATSQLAANAKASLVEGKDVGLFDGFDGWDDEEPEVDVSTRDEADDFHGRAGGNGGRGGDMDGWRNESAGSRNGRSSPGTGMKLGARKATSKAAHDGWDDWDAGKAPAAATPKKANTDGWDDWEADKAPAAATPKKANTDGWDDDWEGFGDQ